jgi:hypothetical protein
MLAPRKVLTPEVLWHQKRYHGNRYHIWSGDHAKNGIGYFALALGPMWNVGISRQSREVCRLNQVKRGPIPVTTRRIGL